MPPPKCSISFILGITTSQLELTSGELSCGFSDNRGETQPPRNNGEILPYRPLMCLSLRFDEDCPPRHFPAVNTIYDEFICESLRCKLSRFPTLCSSRPPSDRPSAMQARLQLPSVSRTGEAQYETAGGARYSYCCALMYLLGSLPRRSLGRHRRCRRGPTDVRGRIQLQNVSLPTEPIFPE
ncbi:hypothetical protein EDD85DRAFT_144443 [Armillaria nabsnona]|nr:hypothetical protein EDD85DRAFT_144443 [Armillaria nabsnona]